MAEYIEREKAIDFVKQYTPHIDGETTMQCVKTALENVPTADVVEVVRCKDCKYYEIHKPSVTLNCEKEGRMIPMNPDDFCSYGAKMDRKDGEGK